MSHILNSRRGKVFAGTLTAMTIAAVAAFAYLSTTGAGSGDATVSAASTALVLSSESVDLTKLDESQTVTILADNTGNNSPQALADIDVTLTPKTAGCPDLSFTIDGATSSTGTVDSDTNVPAGDDGVAVGTFELHLNNNATAVQDDCLDGVDIDYVGNAS